MVSLWYNSATVYGMGQRGRLWGGGHLGLLSFCYPPAHFPLQTTKVHTVKLFQLLEGSVQTRRHLPSTRF